MFLSDEERKLYEQTKWEEEKKLHDKELEERKEKILKKAKEDAKPLKDKIKKGLSYLKRIQFNDDQYRGNKK